MANVVARPESVAELALQQAQATTLRQIQNEEVETLESELRSDQSWIDSAKVLYEAYNKKPFEGSDEEAGQYGLDQMSNQFASFTNLDIWGEEDSKGLAEVLTSWNGWSDHEKTAYAYMATVYEDKDITWAGFGRGLRAVSQDLTNFASVGAAGTLVGAPFALFGKWTGRKAAREGMMYLMRGHLKKHLFATGAAVSAVDGGLINAADDAIRQNLERRFATVKAPFFPGGAPKPHDWGRTAASVRDGVVAGGLLFSLAGGGPALYRASKDLSKWDFNPFDLGNTGSGVQITPESQRLMLDMDLPLSNQTPEVLAALDDMAKKEGDWSWHPTAMEEGATGREFYDYVAQFFDGEKAGGYEDISQWMTDAGLTGITSRQHGPITTPQIGRAKMMGLDTVVYRSLQVTPYEAKYFDAYLNEAGLEEIVDQVPSFRYQNGKVTVADDDLPALDEWLMEAVNSDRSDGILPPPRWSNDSFIKKLSTAEEGRLNPGEMESWRQERARMLGFDTDAFHGSPRDLEEFTNEFSNIQGHYGGHHYFSDSLDDINANYADPDGPDITNRMDDTKERLSEEADLPDDVIDAAAKEVLGVTNEGAIYPVKLRLKNPVVIEPDSGTRPETVWEYEAKFDDDGDLIEETGEAIELLEVTEQVLREWDVGAGGGATDVMNALLDFLGNGEITASQFDKAIRDNVFDAYDPVSGEPAGSGAIIADIWHRMGHDGIQMHPHGMFNMEGIEPGTRHYVVFDPKNIRSTSARFDPKKSSSAKLLAGGAPIALMIQQRQQEKEKSE